MQQIRQTLTHFPRLKAILKSIYDRLQGLPPVSNTEISNELIWACVGKDDPIILEIGCNDGTHTLRFLEIFKNPTIYCFEPDPRAIARFKANVGQHPNIHLFEMALSDHDGEISFYQSSGQSNEDQTPAMPNGWDLSGSIRQPKEHLIIHPWVTFDQKITVTTSTLDTWCNNHGIETIDFIWMDVQGAEVDVFRGGANSLEKTKFIYTEYSNQELYKGQVNLITLMKHLKTFNILIRYPGDVLLSHQQLAGEPNKTLRQMAS